MCPLTLLDRAVAVCIWSDHPTDTGPIHAITITILILAVLKRSRTDAGPFPS